MIERKNPRTAKVGFYSVAHATYWDQFPGLLDNMMKYHRDTAALIESYGVEVVDYGMVDSSEKAYEVADKIAGDGVDVLFTNMITYATSSVFAPIVRKAQMPVVLVALQPRDALDYTQANTFMQLENDNICSVPEFRVNPVVLQLCVIGFPVQIELDRFGFSAFEKSPGDLLENDLIFKRNGKAVV